MTAQILDELTGFYKRLTEVGAVSEADIKKKEKDYILDRRRARFEQDNDSGNPDQRIESEERPTLGSLYERSGYTASKDMIKLIQELGESHADDEHPGTNTRIGLGLSGGGIRSASFCLGAIQVLLKYRIFQNVDYLSTVSGGGYIGSSFSALYANHKFDFDFAHQKGNPEPVPFRYLRNHANYLLPNGAIDVFRMIAVFLKGLLSNIAIIGSTLFLLAAFIAIFMVGPYQKFWVAPAGWVDLYSFASGFPLTALFAAITILEMITFGFARRDGEAGTAADKDEVAGGRWSWRDRSERMMAGILAATLFVAAFEGQLLLIEWLAIKIEEQPSLVYAGFIGFLPLLARFVPTTVLKEIKSLAVRNFMIAVGLLGIMIFIGMYIGLASAIHSERFDLLKAENLQSLIWSSGALLTLMFIFADINLTSLHSFYRDRLSKAFLFTILLRSDKELDSAKHVDPLPLSRLQNSRGPYHLLNAALNMTHPNASYRRGRRADFFLFSPFFIGSDSTGYCHTETMEAVSPHVDLGTAMAISGAAAAPNAGRHVNPLLRFLLASLNVRLNYWMPHPGKIAAAFQHSLLRRTVSAFNVVSQRFKAGPIFLWREMFGRTNVSGRLVNLSDGGHLENMGLYQLLARRCALIIICDGEHDPKMQFSGLLEAVRMAQIDLGVRISFDGLDEIRLGTQGHAVGTIEYGEPDKDEDEQRAVQFGKLLYLKSSLLGDSGLQDSLGSEQFASSKHRDDREYYDAYSYVAQYRATHPDFPHETTGDQFFGEQQFECYRALGYIVAEDAIADRPDAPSLFLKGASKSH
jgi:hypothetical protein